MNLREEAKSIEPKLIEIRRTVHQNPELGFEEFETANYICKNLDELGVDYKRNIAKTGIVVTIIGSGEGKRIMIRADIDALPMHEDNDVPYKSKIDGKMHACGHDAHIACLLGAVELLNNRKGEFKGTVDLLFQPSEEGGSISDHGGSISGLHSTGGALPMIQEGAIGDPENPHIDAAIALHVTNLKRAGNIEYGDGPFTGSADEVYISVNGKGGHASAPHETIDPVYIASQISIALQGWLSRLVDPMEPVVITIGKIAGGFRQNIISDTCRMEGTLRTLNEEVRDMIKAKLPDMVNNIAKAFGGTAELEIIKGYAVGVNDVVLNQHIAKAYTDLFGEEGLDKAEKAQLGAEDFYEFSLRGKIPVAMFWLDTRNDERGIDAPNHSALFDVDESALHVGSATLAGAAISYLNSN